MKIIIFGESTALAQDLIELLKYEKCEILLFNENQFDISDFGDVYSLLGSYVDSFVINCIECNLETCEKNEKLAFQINDKGIKNLSEVCLKNQIHLTQISTNLVFEGLKKEPYLEQDETYPLTIYGKSKLAGESHVRALGGKGLVIRTDLLYGKQKNDLHKFLDRIEMGINVEANNKQVFSPTYTMDLANAIIQLSLNKKSGIFHVTNSGHCTMYEFVKKAVQLLGYNTKYLKEKIDEENTNRNFILSMNRLERTLPEPVRSWEKALEQFLIEIKKL